MWFGVTLDLIFLICKMGMILAAWKKGVRWDKVHCVKWLLAMCDVGSQ